MFLIAGFVVAACIAAVFLKIAAHTIFKSSIEFKDAFLREPPDEPRLSGGFALPLAARPLSKTV